MNATGDAYTLGGTAGQPVHTDQETDQSFGTPVVVLNPPPPNSTVISYAYNGLYRLKRATSSSGETFEYAYDAVGNRTAYTRTLSSQVVTTLRLRSGQAVHLRRGESPCVPIDTGHSAPYNSIVLIGMGSPPSSTVVLMPSFHPKASPSHLQKTQSVLACSTAVSPWSPLGNPEA